MQGDAKLSTTSPPQRDKNLILILILILILRSLLREEGVKFRYQFKPESAAALLWALAKLPAEIRAQVRSPSDGRGDTGSVQTYLG